MSEIEPVTPGNLPALPEEDMSIGLEDFDQSDQIMPTLRINHEEGVWEDGLSGEKFAVLDIIALGLIKQRVLWEPEVEENSKGPLCRSYDFTNGHPDISRFPWSAAPNFAVPAVGVEHTVLPCEECPLKEWGSHPKRDTPWCSEQHTFAVLQRVGEDSLAPALLTVQRSAIKPSKTYLTSFARSKTALFTVWTRIELDHRKRGTVNFAVPKFVKGQATPQEEWPYYAQTYRDVREFVQTPRFSDAEDEIETTPPGAPATAAPVATTAPAPAPTAAPAPAAPVAAPVAPAPAPAATDDDEELPF